MKLPGDMTLRFTKGRTYFAGSEVLNLEGKGVVPDVRVPVTLETEQAKLRGEDPVMDAALDVLAEMAAEQSKNQTD
jgi:C-terminal processing protease CtpA/Prc